MPDRTKGSVLYNSRSPLAPLSLPAFFTETSVRVWRFHPAPPLSKNTGVYASEPIGASLPGARAGPDITLVSPAPLQKEASVTPDLGCGKGANEGEACSFSMPA